ncbi:hypothetical protein NIES19_39900 [Anabaena cylindrica PCC 7122]|nr:hypothetical protein NIES19_39900 [Anabaena cylindrica PCC 7122]
MTKGTVAEIRDRTLRVLKGCGVEMLIIDEADRFKPKTFAEVRDIFDKLEIAVILVGTDRLDAVIKRDEQVYNRFRACHRFGKFSGEDFNPHSADVKANLGIKNLEKEKPEKIV